MCPMAAPVKERGLRGLVWEEGGILACVIVYIPQAGGDYHKKHHLRIQRTVHHKERQRIVFVFVCVLLLKENSFQCSWRRGGRL